MCDAIIVNKSESTRYLLIVASVLILICRARSCLAIKLHVCVNSFSMIQYDSLHDIEKG